MHTCPKCQSPTYVKAGMLRRKQRYKCKICRYFFTDAAQHSRGHSLTTKQKALTMVNAGKNITYNYFDQNRFFVGLGYQFTKSLNVQLGYINLFQQLPSGNHYVNNHVLRFFVFHNLDLRKKDE